MLELYVVVHPYIYIYSPHMLYAPNSEGFTEWFVAILPYGDELRKARQLLHRHLQINVVPEYQGIQESSIHRLLNRILESPDKFIRHIKQ